MQPSKGRLHPNESGSVSSLGADRAIKITCPSQKREEEVRAVEKDELLVVSKAVVKW